jgi:hypothetical protein
MISALYTVQLMTDPAAFESRADLCMPEHTSCFSQYKTLLPNCPDLPIPGTGPREPTFNSPIPVTSDPFTCQRSEQMTRSARFCIPLPIFQARSNSEMASYSATTGVVDALPRVAIPALGRVYSAIASRAVRSALDSPADLSLVRDDVRITCHG